jgi:hypothetical protein
VYSPDAIVEPNDCTDGGFTGAHLEFDGAEIRIVREVNPANETANARLAHIEVFNAGKFDRMGHYPIHYHLIKDGTGGYVRA